jgi:hypothetical protein
MKFNTDTLRRLDICTAYLGTPCLCETCEETSLSLLQAYVDHEIKDLPRKVSSSCGREF